MFLSIRNDAEVSLFLWITNFTAVKIINPPIPTELVAIENCDVKTARPRKI